MFKINNFFENDSIHIREEKGAFRIVEYKKDLSVVPLNAMEAYFAQEMNVRKRQLVCDLSCANITVQSGAMQWTVGDVSATTGIKGAGDFLSKIVKGKATGEGAIKPEYVGSGTLVLEPTFKHIILEDLEDWNNALAIEDGMYLASEETVEQKAIMRSNISSSLFGGEGLFNLSLRGSGIVALESPCPREELIEIILDEDTLKIDGNMVIAWSESLKFSVERSGKTLIGSATSGEGLVNVYAGTGRVLLAPVSLVRPNAHNVPKTSEKPASKAD